MSCELGDVQMMTCDHGGKTMVRVATGAGQAMQLR